MENYDLFASTTHSVCVVRDLPEEDKTKLRSHRISIINYRYFIEFVISETYNTLCKALLQQDYLRIKCLHCDLYVKSSTNDISRVLYKLNYSFWITEYTYIKM